MLAVKSTTSAYPADAVPTTPPYSGRGRPPASRYPGEATNLAALALAAGRSRLRRVTWRHGSRKNARNPTAAMTSRFLALRVRPANRDIPRTADGALPDCWMIAELPPAELEPTDYSLSTLAPDTPLRELVRMAEIRRRIEHDYRELKDGLGLGNVEGRSYLGWHHHVTLAHSPLHSAHNCASTRSPCADPTIYAVLRELQTLLATWTGACHTCRRPYPDST